MDKKAALGAGTFAGTLAGMIAGYGGGRLGLTGFMVFLLFVAPIKPGGSKAVAIMGFVVSAAVCAAVFSR